MSSNRHELIAANWIQQRWPHRPRYGIVLGTGAGQVAKAIKVEAEFPYGDIPDFPRSTAVGHLGLLVCGEFAGQKVVAMAGRFHLYEGYSVEQSTIGVRVMHQLGIQCLFLSNAAGGINPKFVSGDIMLIDSHLDLMFQRAQARNTTQLSDDETLADRLFVGKNNARIDSAYDRQLIAYAMQAAREHNLLLHLGVYVAMLGPNYETRAEYRFLRKLGGDTVGMSTAPEVAVASELGIRVLAASIVTNVAKPDALDRTSGDEVVHFADVAAPKLRKLFEAAIYSDSNC